MLHTIPLAPANLQGCFSPQRPPILSVDSGDSVVCQTLDVRWGHYPNSPDEPVIIPPPARPDPAHDTGHCLVGPIAVRGAAPGMALEVRVDALRPGPAGVIFASLRHRFQSELGLPGDRLAMPWRIDADAAVARNAQGRTVALRPFLGVMGNSPAEPGIHPTPPPRPVGGNIDCKELVVGSTLYLPIAVPGALFSLGDGHAVQGDGELSGTAIECPMDHVQVTLRVRDDLHLTWPLAQTSAGWITFGFSPDLTEAMLTATNNMLDLLMAELSVSRTEAIVLASVAVDLRITQIVNGTLGVHAILTHATLAGLRGH
ncbi:MAG: acetamidase/formamidase family protein [Anaerolineae bacterium]